MNIHVAPGKYVAAISGGVDSMVLLFLLSQLNADVVVAHYDHGIRPNSKTDRLLVQRAAKNYGMVFEYAEGKLGPDASEDTARRARYEFLGRIQAQYNAQAVITAHHQDDLIETALINMLRGTGHKGLIALKSTDQLIRPMLDYTKKQIVDFAAKNNLEWHEDYTNEDTKYLRNYLRKNIMPKLSAAKRKQLVNTISSLGKTSQQLDINIADYLKHGASDVSEVNRANFINLPHNLACEAMAAWLRLNGLRDFDKKAINRLVVSAKTLRPGQSASVGNGVSLHINKTNICLKT